MGIGDFFARVPDVFVEEELAFWSERFGDEGAEVGRWRGDGAEG